MVWFSCCIRLYPGIEDSKRTSNYFVDFEFGYSEYYSKKVNDFQRLRNILFKDLFVIFIAIVFKLYQYLIVIILFKFLILLWKIKCFRYAIIYLWFQIAFPTMFLNYVHIKIMSCFFFYLEKLVCFGSLWGKELSLVPHHLELWLQLYCWSMTQRKNWWGGKGMQTHISIHKHSHFTHAWIHSHTWKLKTLFL